jgi:hypothetical protein
MAYQFASRQTADIVQNVGDIDILFAHHDIADENGIQGNILYIGGFRAQGEIVSMQQMMENSTLVPILGGGSVHLTNANTAGRITFNAARQGRVIKGPTGALQIQALAAKGGGSYFDINNICDILQSLPSGDGSGGTILIMSRFAGSAWGVLLPTVTLVSHQPIMYSGNDVGNYQAVFNYSSPVFQGDDFDPTDGNNMLKDAFGAGGIGLEGISASLAI